MFKKLLFVVVGCSLLIPAMVLAHGGVEHNTDDAVVQLYQSPLSPVAHEFVKADFIFADKVGNRLQNMPVKLTLTDTHQADESKDKVILARDTKTDANGIVSFGFRYSKPDYYDIDLDFALNGKPQEAGFLVGVRNPYKNWYSLGYVAVFGLGCAAGYLVFWGVGRRLKA